METTRQQLEEQLAAARGQIAALRDLIDAAAACADVPIAAADHQASDRLAWNRADWIQTYLRDIDYSTEYLCAVLAGKAQRLREIAAEPLKYQAREPEGDEPVLRTPSATRPCRSPQAHGYSAVAASGTVQCDVPEHHGLAPAARYDAEFAADAASLDELEPLPAQGESDIPAGPHCGVQWPNLGPAGGAWTCTLDEGHDGDHEARGPGGRRLLSSASSVIPQGHPDILTGAEVTS